MCSTYVLTKFSCQRMYMYFLRCRRPRRRPLQGHCLMLGLTLFAHLSRIQKVIHMCKMPPLTYNGYYYPCNPLLVNQNPFQLQTSRPTSAGQHGRGHPAHGPVSVCVWRGLQQRSSLGKSVFCRGRRKLRPRRSENGIILLTKSVYSAERGVRIMRA